jgi:ADP-heptose:LPS heptosyltransferase
MMRVKPVVLAGKTSLKELCFLFKKVDLMVTCDSGPMHIAAAMGTPTVALFGPTDPGRTGSDRMDIAEANGLHPI